MMSIFGRYMTMLLTILATVGLHITNRLFWYKHPVEQKLFAMVRQMIIIAPYSNANTNSN